jgi:hypothetical protein
MVADAAGNMLVVGDHMIELYAATGAILSQHAVISGGAAFAPCGGFVLGSEGGIIAASGPQNTLRILDALCNNRVLAVSDSLPAAPVALAVMPRTSSNVSETIIALLADGSLAIVTVSSDRSQLAAQVIPPAAVWTGSAPSSTPFVAAVTLDDGTAIVAAAAGTQLLVGRAVPAQSAFTVGSHIALPGPAVGVAVAKSVKRGHVLLFAAIEGGTFVAHHIAAGSGHSVAAASCNTPNRSDVLELAASPRGVCALIQQGTFILPLLLSPPASGAFALLPGELMSLPSGAHAVAWQRTGRNVLALVDEGIVSLPVSLASNMVAASVDDGVSPILILTATNQSLGGLRSVVAQRCAGVRAAVETARDEDTIMRALAEIRLLRQCAAALLERERRQNGRVDPSNSAVMRLDEGLLRLRLACLAVALWVQGGCPSLPALDQLRHDRSANAEELKRVAGGVFHIATPAMKLAADRFEIVFASANGAPLSIDLLLSALNLQANAAPAALLVSALSDPATMTANPDACALLAFYFAHGASLQEREHLASELACSRALIHLGAVAWFGDVSPVESDELHTAARCVTHATSCGLVAAAVLETAFTQLTDAASTRAAFLLLPSVRDLVRKHGGASAMYARVSLRVLLIAALQGDTISLDVLSATFDTADTRPVYIAAFVYAAAQRRDASILQASFTLRDVDTAVALLRAEHAVVAVQLLVAARRFSDALDLLQTYAPHGEEDAAAAADLAAHLRSHAVRASGSAMLASSRGHDTGDDVAAAAGSVDLDGIERCGIAADSALYQPATDKQHGWRWWTEASGSDGGAHSGACPVIQSRTRRACGHQQPCPYHAATATE